LSIEFGGRQVKAMMLALHKLTVGEMWLARLSPIMSVQWSLHVKKCCMLMKKTCVKSQLHLFMQIFVHLGINNQ